MVGSRSSRWPFKVSQEAHTLGLRGFLKPSLEPPIHVI